LLGAVGAAITRVGRLILIGGVGDAVDGYLLERSCLRHETERLRGPADTSKSSSRRLHGSAASVRLMNTPPTLISEKEIADRVATLAAEIDAAYADAERLILIGVLKGSFIFLSDLARKLTIPHRVEFLAVSSYGEKESETADSVRLLMDVRHAISGEHVLVIEDIVDTGHTLDYLLRLFQARDPASLKTCTLLHKPDRTEQEVEIDFLGFTIPDVWVVGYGLDYAERYRTLPYIGDLPPEMR
jgi:hypoxanthine phosphoribosyltransferase